MFKKLINWLYFKFGDKNIIAMTRRQLGIFSKPYTDEKIKKDQAVWCLKAIEDKIFDQIVNQLIEEIKNAIILKSDAKCIIYDRFTINGLYLIKERLQFLAMEAMPKNEEPFDPHSPI